MRRFSESLFFAILMAALLGCQKAPPVAVPSLPPPPSNPWESVDQYALSAPPELANSPERLAGYLAKAGEEMAVARAIYRWIAANISYDVAGMRSGEVGDLSPEAVLARRAAVCGGFGNLFEDLAHRAGLEVVTIYGHAKGTGYQVGEPVEKIPIHAWNSFQSGGKWHLVDCTWGAGALEESGLFEARFEPFYFDTPPDLFVYSHFPNEERWQLLAPAWSHEEFSRRPWLKPAFFHAGLLPKSVAVLRESQTATLVLKANLAGELRVYLMQCGEKVFKEAFPPEVSGRETRYSIPLPGPGLYAIRLFAQHSRSPETLEWAGDFPVPTQ